MPDNVYKSDEVSDDDSKMVITKLGPEEKFAKNVLKSLKEKISEARERLNELEQEIEQKRNQAETEKNQILEETRQKAESEAQSIKEKAQQEAQELVEEKEAEVQQARDEGYEEGFQEGKDEAHQETISIIENAHSILDEAKRERDAFVESNIDEFIRLATKLAKQVVHDYVEMDNSVVRRVLRSALDEIEDALSITIVMHPDDLTAVKDVVSEYEEENPSLEEIKLTDDSKMKRGGCRIRTNYGDIEAELDTQLEHLSQSLLESDVTADPIGDDEQSSDGD